MRVAKTKALISFAVTSKLICVFVFAYADCWFSHEVAQAGTLMADLLLGAQSPGGRMLNCVLIEWGFESGQHCVATWPQGYKTFFMLNSAEQRI